MVLLVLDLLLNLERKEVFDELDRPLALVQIWTQGRQFHFGVRLGGFLAGGRLGSRSKPRNRVVGLGKGFLLHHFTFFARFRRLFAPCIFIQVVVLKLKFRHLVNQFVEIAIAKKRMPHEVDVKNLAVLFGKVDVVRRHRFFIHYTQLKQKKAAVTY